jgi:hypothetical protein
MPTRAELRVALERLSTLELLSTLGPVVSSAYTEDALAVIREILAERGVDPATAPAPACPGCNTPLEVEQGELDSRTSCLGLVLWGPGYQPTWFTSSTSSTREVVLRPGLPATAARCRHCGLIMFGGRL